MQKIVKESGRSYRMLWVAYACIDAPTNPSHNTGVFWPQSTARSAWKAHSAWRRGPHRALWPKSSPPCSLGLIAASITCVCVAKRVDVRSCTA